MKYPAREKKMFVETGPAEEIATMGQTDILDQWYNYSLGYYNAAKTLAEQSLEVDDDFPKMQEKRKDEHIAPIIFLYRHYLEITLKYIYLEWSNTSEEMKEQMLNDTEHSLEKSWNYIKPLVEKTIEPADKSKLIGFEYYIRQFVAEDPTSMKFRYPTNKEMQLFLQNERKINIKNLIQRMDEMEKFLAFIVLPMLDVLKFHDEANNYRTEGMNYFAEGKYDEALEHYEKAYESKRIMVGEEHPDILIIRVHIAQALMLQNKLDEALNYHLSTLSIIENMTKIDNEVLSIIYKEIILIYKSKKDVEKIAEYECRFNNIRKDTDKD